MPARVIPRAAWGEFLAAFGRQHRAWLASVEGAGGASDRIERPLAGITADAPGGRITAIRFAFGGRGTPASEIRVDDPRVVRLLQTPEGADRALEIEDSARNCTRLAFRASAFPDEVDGLATGEL